MIIGVSFTFNRIAVGKAQTRNLKARPGIVKRYQRSRESRPVL